MSLENALNVSEGDFINTPITATVKFAETKTYNGRNFYTALLEDGQFKANVSCNKDVFTENNNKRVTFSIEGKGKGFSMKRKNDFNGKAQFGFGENVSVSPAGEPTPGQQAAASHSESVQAHPTPAPSGAIAGVTVGMAINKAVDLFIAEGGGDWNGGERVKDVASDLIRIANDLQAGNLSIPANVPEGEDIPF